VNGECIAGWEGEVRFWLVLGAVLAGAAVASGAFGAHALRSLPDNDLVTWETAARYHMYHALGVLAVGVLQAAGLRSLLLHLSGVAFLAGLAFFSGALYALALSGIRVLAMFAPIGGSAFIAGWLLMAVGAAIAARAPDTSVQPK
jgi:uncharacterized membrane protein YgdD (TMEM256/DUF423 family)